MKTERCVIGGKPVDTAEHLEVLDPSTGELIARVARAGAEEVDAAVVAARTATREWRRRPTSERATVLRCLGQLVRRDREQLALVESRDTGKPLGEAFADVDVAARFFEYYAGTVEAFFGRTHPPSGDTVAWTRNEPHGVTGHIIPWNYPIETAGRTLAPALAVGNCAVIKPAEDAPLTTLRLADLALEAGVPPGVLNVVPGLGAEAGAALAAHPEVDHVSFTGSVATGSAVATAAAANVVPAGLELGGKSPNIVFGDADLDRALPALVQAALKNAGQTCSAGSRLLVHESVRDKVLDRVAEAFADLEIGSGPRDPDLGPLISAHQRDRVAALVQRARDDGQHEHPLTKQISVPDTGFFIPPALFVDVDPASEIAREEVFGPVLSATTFSDLDEAVALANGTQYGLVAGVWTSNLNTAHVLTEEIDAGQVFVNCYGAGVEAAFGGVRKSGYGREKGFEALEAFCRVKTVVLQTAP